MNTRYFRDGWLVSLSLALLLFLSACADPDAPVTTEREAMAQAMVAAYTEAGLNEQQAAQILLDRFTFGSSAGQLAETVADGLPQWFDRQLNADHPDREVDERLAGFDSLAMSDVELMAVYPSFSDAVAHMRRFYPGLLPPRDEPVLDFTEIGIKLSEFAKQHGLRQMEPSLLPQLHGQKIVRALYSDNQLREVMVDFWSNHFFTSTRSFSARPWVLGFERDVLRAGALGEFATLLQNSTRHPAMLSYYLYDAEPTELSSAGPRAGHSLMEQRLRQLSADAVHAAELAQAVAVPLALDEEYSLVLDRQFWPATGPNRVFARNLLHHQTLGREADVSEAEVLSVARAFSGWTVYPYGVDQRWYTVDETAAAPLGFVRQGSFWFRADQHDAGEKSLFGHTLAAGQGVTEGAQVLELLARHPATARHIASKLVNHFVGDKAAAALHERIAQAFTDSGGDVPAMLTALVTSPDFWRDAAARDKVKTPFHFVISALRGAGADAELSSTAAVSDWMTRLGQPLYGHLDAGGYPDNEDYWLSPGALSERVNFALALQQGQIDGVAVNADEQLALSLLRPEFQLY